MSRELVLGLLVGLLLLAPSASAHGSVPDGHPQPVAGADSVQLLPPTAGYTGPGNVPFLSFFQGAWLYGQSSTSPLGKQLPRQIFGSGDWLVWEDTAAGRVFVYNVPAGNGYYVGNVSAIQRNPAISGSLVVWEEYRARQPAQIWSFDLATNELRQVSRGPGNHRNPSIDGTLVAWEDDRNRTTDIWGYDFANDTEFPIYRSVDTKETNQDPLVLGHIVYFRTFRFNIWDIRGADISNGTTEVLDITNDPKIQGAPFTNGRDLFFLNQFLGLTWDVARYDPVQDRVTDTSLNLQDASPVTISEDRMLEVVHDQTYAQLVVRNVTTSTTAHVSGDISLVGSPLLLGRTAYFAARTPNGTSLVALDVSPFAFGKPASLVITSPGTLYPWVRPVVVRGLLQTGPGWSEPVTFSYQVDDQPPVAIPPSESWRVTLDNAQQPAGAHQVVFRATFREGPPVSARLTLSVPVANANIDVQQAGQEFHAARVFGALNEFVLANPAMYLILVVVIALVALLLVRGWLMLRQSRAEYIIEYVPPEE